MTIYPKNLTDTDFDNLKGMKLLYTGSSEGILTGRVKEIKQRIGKNSASIVIEIIWGSGPSDHDLIFSNMRFINKNEIKNDTYQEITFYPYGYNRSCKLCTSKCKAETPCDLYESLLRRRM